VGGTADYSKPNDAACWRDHITAGYHACNQLTSWSRILLYKLTVSRLVALFLLRNKHKTSTLLLFRKMKLHKIVSSQTCCKEALSQKHLSSFSYCVENKIFHSARVLNTRALVVTDEDTRAKVIFQYHL
jgi:hypothetical protein